MENVLLAVALLVVAFVAFSIGYLLGVIEPPPPSPPNYPDSADYKRGA